MPLDVLFVGGGPANLAGAIHLSNLAQEKGLEIEIGLIEKGSSFGAHSLSGAIMDPRALKELIPDYEAKGCPIERSDCKDAFYYLTSSGKLGVPFIPSYMHNDGCQIISLSKFTRWLGEMAEEMGIMVFPGFSGTEVLYGEDKKTVIGVATGDKGVDKEGKPKGNYEPGVDLTARVTVFGEGPKGSLQREIGHRLGIFSDSMPQVFETAIKEVIQLPEENAFFSSPTTVVHTFGYPLGMNTKGGGFLYKMKDNRVALGLVIGLDYEDAGLEPYEAFIRYKQHPLIADIIKDGKVLQQGAKTLAAGGYYTIPQLAVNGAMFVGDSASMLNIQRLKGIHTAMKSGMLAAEAIIKAFEADDFSAKTLKIYEDKVRSSWINTELYQSRNFSQALGKKGLGKFIHIIAQYVSGGRGAVDPMKIAKDSGTFKSGTGAPTGKGLEYDGELYVDKLTGVYLSGTRHEESQPCHLKILDMDICLNKCRETFQNPCTRFCPGQVYELEEEGGLRMKLNPANCLHCKTCEIKDPYENILWTCPEGGGGPSYTIT